MENFKEFHPIEKEKDQSVFKKLRKRVLAATLSGLVLAGPVAGKLEKPALKQLKKDGVVEKLEDSFKKTTTKELVELRLQESALEEQEPEKIVTKLKYIIEKIGGFTAVQLGCPWATIYNLNNRPEAKKKLIENLNQKPEIKDEAREPIIMENLQEIGLDPSIVKEILKTLPPSWTKEVALITYLDKPSEIILNEKTNKKVELVAYHQSRGKEKLSEIYFFQGAKKRKVDQLLYLLLFEYAHANNWRSRCDLSLDQRISLFYETIRRLESPDRYRDPLFIEAIKYREKEQEIVKKAVEYWAAICMWTLAGPESNFISEADKKLVFDYLKLTDPEFDPVKAAQSRDKIIMDYLKKK